MINGILGRTQLEAWAKDGGVVPFHPEAIASRNNEICIDLSLGCIAFNKTWLPDKPSEITFTLEVPPVTMMLARTKEYIALPNNLAGLLTIRSEWAQKGLNQLTSILVKPNWSGYLILELYFVPSSDEDFLVLSSGDRIAQLALFGVG
ncbi:hypothetical protein PCC6912_50750 [Chlorogloeopsis fritschii PCC 6912]|uniref:Uncharacterized protein n=1 Tax=Chlorogloeopsis fritschii PCC 6912 TaxID=211165 RepID=A0A3S0ZPX5_CHLFR|nr:hypothetical protein [Chlorogloeopsis fritschii]RUR74897.1 hypothetical protein PCC6912_50750 [Chlorogloeopsis fritschii PCC 6912]